MVAKGVYVQLLGGLVIHSEDRRLRLHLSGVTLEVLAYLLSQGRDVRRDALADLFWEDVDPARGRAALNTALWRINKRLKALGWGAVVSTLETVRLETGAARLDIRDLEEGVRAAVRGRADPAGPLDDAVRTELAATVDRCQGAFLDGCDSAWAVLQRERLLDLYLRALNLLMRDCGARRDYEEGLEYGRRILIADPFHEQAQCQVMWLYALNGQRVRALVQYRNYERLLSQEMGIRPMPETVALFELIQSDMPGEWNADPRGQARAGGDLVGRLMSALADSRANFYEARRAGV